MSIAPSVHFKASFQNQTGTALELSFQFYSEPAWIDEPADECSAEYEYNVVLRSLMPSLFNGTRALNGMTLAPEQTFTLQWRDAWNFRCIAVGDAQSSSSGGSVVCETSYLLTMDEPFWRNDPAPLRYSFIVQPETGYHVLMYENYAFDASIITFEYRNKRGGERGAPLHRDDGLLRNS